MHFKAGESDGIKTQGSRSASCTHHSARLGEPTGSPRGLSSASIACAIEEHTHIYKQVPRARTDAIPRLGSAGSKRTAFFAVQDQTSWLRCGQSALSAAAAVEKGCQSECQRQLAGLDREFHLSLWNATGVAHDGIGALTRSMDK